MTKSRNITFQVLSVLAVGLVITAIMTWILTLYFGNVQFVMLGNFCEVLTERYPDCEQAIPEILKELRTTQQLSTADSMLTEYGYRKTDFLGEYSNICLIGGICFALGGGCFLVMSLIHKRKTEKRIRQLTDYLEKVNIGGQGLLVDITDDNFSELQDEIYKTITTLYQTRDAALAAKENYATNLANIAHQLKTPITAISLSTQMSKENPSYPYTEQISKQLYRLTHLEEALLLLSRIDAGTLTLKRQETDVFTLLTLAADNLQELSDQTGVSVEITETDAVEVLVDMNWTMEAVMNILKNCMEHTPKGQAVHCTYDKNPLYVQITIQDEGTGFAKEDLGHMFERFYRGKNATEGGIGIGLSLAKSIIEMQNGVIGASCVGSGGACFEIRFYQCN